MLALPFAACEPAPARPGPDTLVLEIGGHHDSLRQALIAAGRHPSPGPSSEADGAAAVDAGADRMRADPAVERVEPPPVREPAPRHIVVELGRGQTLIHLAKLHLGDGNRYREILTANGWTESDARRLRAGQSVKIPVTDAAQPR